MKCISCGRCIEDNSLFCNWCGGKQIKLKKKKAAVTVPEPRRLSSGKWFIQLRKENICITRNTADACRKDAVAARVQWERDEADGLHKPDPHNGLILSDAIDAYIESRRSRLKLRSIQQYEYIRDHRFSSLMPLPISEISGDDVDAAVEAELKKPSRRGGNVSPKTVIDAYGLIATVLRKYNKDIELNVTLPEIQRSFPVLLTPEEIYPAVKGTDIELDCLLAMWLSLSMSEIRGLTKSKSVRGDKLYIVETVVDTYGVPERRTGGKEEFRPRVCGIPPYIKTLIDAVDGDIIEPRSGHAVYMRFQTELRRAGLSPMRFHHLRHVNASVMAEEMIPTVVAQERGGWKTDFVMKKVYTHTFTPSRLEADKKMDSRFEKLIFANEITNKAESP